jgi:hypothetical protein
MILIGPPAAIFLGNDPGLQPATAARDRDPIAAFR